MNNVTKEIIQQGLIKKISSLTGILEENINIHNPLAEYGLDSLLAVSLSSDIEDWLSITLEPTVAWDFPTIEKLSEHLIEQVNVNSTYQNETKNIMTTKEV